MSIQKKWAAVNLPLPVSDKMPSASSRPPSLHLHSMDMEVSSSHPPAPSTEPSSSGVASSNSTPPTSLPDSMQMDLDVEKRENMASTPSTSASKSIDVAAAPRDTPESEKPQPEPEQVQEHDADDMLQAIIAQNASDPAQSIESPPTNQQQQRTSSESSTDTHNNTPLGSRPRRNRGSVATYNLAKLSGTDVHGKRASKGDDVDARRRERRRTTGSNSFVTAKSEEPADAQISNIPDRLEQAENDATTHTTSRTKPIRAGAGALPSEDAMNKAWSPARAAGAGNRTPRRGSSITRGSGSGKGGRAIGLRAAAHATATVRSRPTAVSKARSESPATHGRYSTRKSGLEAESLATKLSTMGKRGRNKFEKGLSRMTRELRRLQDTNEFAHIETAPVVHTVWSNGKLVNIDPATGEPEITRAARKKQQEEEEEEAERQRQEKEAEEEAAARAAIAAKKKKAKKWLDRGLYAGQPRPYDPTRGLSAADRKKLQGIPELLNADLTNKAFPTPLFNGLRLLIEGRDFKLPYDICNPLPPGLPKPDEWRKITKNRFVGDAAAIWKKTPHFTDSSTCVCTPEDGCAEDCQNRIMLYECDDTNCNIGREHCSNRAFQDLQARVKAGGKYRIGVEVYKTEDRGYGVRSNRCFEPNQIIMEYTGEIITEEECERRMNEEYKNNECYYLMSFDQNMIIDATTGSIARFVNHSCAPNCRMIKWIVSGQPRMALFAGDRPIMTGDELTYDYNFDPFSAKNVQKCLCGSENCRGVLGPKNTKPNPNSAAAKMATAAAASQKASTKPIKVAKGAKAAAKPGKAIVVKGISGRVRAAEIKTVKGSLKQKSGAKKRKLKDIFAPVADDDEDEEEAADSYAPPAKKRKIKSVTRALKKGIAGVKRTLSSTSSPATPAARGTASPRGKTRGRGGSVRGRVLAKRASTGAISKQAKKDEPVRRSHFSLAQFSVASPTPDPEPVKTPEPEPEVESPLKVSEPPSSRPSTGGALRSSGAAASIRISRTLPKIIPINRNRGGGDIESSTSSSADEVPPASSAAAAAARAMAAAHINGTGSESDKTPPRKRRRVQIPKPPISASRSSSITYVESSLATGGPAYKSPTSGGPAPVTIPSVNGATLVEGKDFVPAFDDEDDIMDLDDHFPGPLLKVHRNSLRDFDRSPRRGIDIRRDDYGVRIVTD